MLNLDCIQHIITQFPSAPYFNLVHKQKLFSIALDFSNGSLFSSFIYEYRPMLSEISDLFTNSYARKFIKVDIYNQFILIRKSISGFVSSIGSYATNQDAINAIKNDQLIFINDNPHVTFAYAVVNLEHTMPRFWNQKLIKPVSNEDPGTFYYGNSNQLIKID
jgi:hypothetical protein